MTGRAAGRPARHECVTPASRLVTVLAVPFNLMGGMFGMNVGGVPLAGHPHGFAIIVGVMALCTAAAAWLALSPAAALGMQAHRCLAARGTRR